MFFLFSCSVGSIPVSRVLPIFSDHAAAMEDYHRTEFGGWSWPSDEPVHPRDTPRFAKLPDGTIIAPAGVAPETARAAAAVAGRGSRK